MTIIVRPATDETVRGCTKGTLRSCTDVPEAALATRLSSEVGRIAVADSPSRTGA